MKNPVKKNLYFKTFFVNLIVFESFEKNPVFGGGLNRLKMSKTEQRCDILVNTRKIIPNIFKIKIIYCN